MTTRERRAARSEADLPCFLASVVDREPLIFNVRIRVSVLVSAITASNLNVFRRANVIHALRLLLLARRKTVCSARHSPARIILCGYNWPSGWPVQVEAARGAGNTTRLVWRGLLFHSLGR